MTDPTGLTKELLPCPFCAEPVRQHQDGFIVCANYRCGAHVNFGGTSNQTDRWNTRQYAGDGRKVRIPTSADEAAMMCLLGKDYLKRHAPERLKQQSND